MFNKSNEGRLPEQLKFFSDGGSRGGSELKISAVEKTGMLNENKNAFIEYLTTDYARENTKWKYFWRLETSTTAI